VVSVGEAMIVVAAFLLHRKEALVACGYMSEQVKFNVPIWKEAHESGELR